MKAKIAKNGDAIIRLTREEVFGLYREDAVSHHQTYRRKAMDAIVTEYLYKGISIRDEFIESITPKESEGKDENR